MAQLATKRIMADIKNFNNSGLNSQGIFINFDDEDIYQINALIFGLKILHMLMEIICLILFFQRLSIESAMLNLTHGKNIRFNPNLYVNGKVCLSIILGTWAGLMDKLQYIKHCVAFYTITFA